MVFFDTIAGLIILFSSPWLWLILFASLLYAAGNYIDELLLSKYEQEVGTMVIISALFGGVIVSIFFSLAIIHNVNLLVGTPLIIQALFVGMLEALWVIPYLYATQRSGAVIAGPLFQAVPVFALAMEASLGVIPTLVQIIGAGIIVAGGIVISIEETEDENGEVKKSIDWTTIGLMSLSVILVAAIYVLFRGSAIETGFISTGFWVGLGTLLTGCVIYGAWKPYRDDFNRFCKHANYKALSIQFGNEILDAGGVYMTNLATTLGPSVMIVTAFNATQPLFVWLVGLIFAGLGISGISTERASAGVWKLILLGIIIISIGVVVLALGQ